MRKSKDILESAELIYKEINVHKKIQLWSLELFIAPNVEDVAINMRNIHICKIILDVIINIIE